MLWLARCHSLSRICYSNFSVLQETGPRSWRCFEDITRRWDARRWSLNAKRRAAGEEGKSVGPRQLGQHWPTRARLSHGHC